MQESAKSADPWLICNTANTHENAHLLTKLDMVGVAFHGCVNKCANFLFKSQGAMVTVVAPSTHVRGRLQFMHLAASTHLCSD